DRSHFVMPQTQGKSSRMKFITFILSLLMITGCGDSATTSNTDAAKSNDSTPQASTEEVSPVSSGVQLPAKSAEDLVAAYKTAFEAGDIPAIKEMVHWGEEPFNESTMTIMFNARIAAKKTGTIPMIEVRDAPEGRFDAAQFTLKPSKMVWGSYSYDGGGGDLRMPIGELDGSFYFCVPKRK
ncbi:hypothetical protein NZK35_16900, partial [Stieleria sp. ICT_E10.1]|uniref:hypothetical protein n=1 Tax=Stieleria sedimenti TaxID=2976331 RepID=UPI0021801F03